MSYGVTDFFAGHLSPNRDTYRRFECGFHPQSGWNPCMNAAQFAVVGWRDDKGVAHFGDYITLRCAKHRATDERTARNRGWGEREYVTFDARAEAKARDRMLADNREEDRLADISAKVIDNLSYVIDHAVLTDEVSETLRVIMFEANERLLVVR